MSRKPRRFTAHLYYKPYLEIRVAEIELKSALVRLKRLKKRDVFEDIHIISPLEVCIDRVEGLLKVQKILIERVEGAIK